MRCVQCGLVRTNPRPTPASIGRYYPATYGPYLATAVDEPPFKRFLRRWSDPLDLAIPRLRPGRLLEIGAASGSYLAQMQRLGWTVTGIELDRASAGRAAERTGARILRQDLASVTFPDAERFDLICAWMVIEHLHDPIRALRRCFEWLTPGGWLAFSVPDGGGWQFRTFRRNWFALEVPRHLYHFSPLLLQQILASCRFEHVRIQWQRSLFDVTMSLALIGESALGVGPGRILRRAAESLPVRTLARAAGIVTAPLHLTGRLTVWAQKPDR